MSKPAYSDYVRHAMRFYARNLQVGSFNNNVDKENWQACHMAIADYSKQEQDVLISVYGSYNTLSDNVYDVSRKYKIYQPAIWDMMRNFEYKIAVCRGLA